MTTSTDDRLKIIDIDTHVTEPPDLWTSRAPAAMRDRVPRIRWFEEEQADFWTLGGVRLMKPGMTAIAGWREYPPVGCPPRFSDIDPSAWDPTARLAHMDHDGIYAQILYPNIATFHLANFASGTDRDVHNLCIRIYNDFLAEFASVDCSRLIPIAAVPFWDLDEAVAEVERAHDLGHKGIMFTQDPTAYGLPSLADRYWDPIWTAATERRMPVNFHIGTGDPTLLAKIDPAIPTAPWYTVQGVRSFLQNADTLSRLILGGVCHRHPELSFVSVESGVGWLPFLLESMDWGFRTNGVAIAHPEFDLLPSEYFRRQIYGSFWFESECARFSISQLQDNIFYETDFPHPTSMSPGPASPAKPPLEYIAETLGSLPPEIQRKILHDNAARVYGLDA